MTLLSLLVITVIGAPSAFASEGDRAKCLAGYPNPSIQVEFDEPAKSIHIVGQPTAEGPHPVIAYTDFEIVGDQLKVVYLNKGAGHLEGAGFTEVMLDRILNEYSSVRRLSNTFLGDDLVAFIKGLNDGLSAADALTKTELAKVYAKFGFTRLKSFFLRHEDGDPFQTLLVDVVFARESNEAKQASAQP